MVRYRRAAYTVVAFTAGFIMIFCIRFETRISVPTLRPRPTPLVTSAPSTQMRRWAGGLFLLSAFYDDREGNGKTANVRLILIRDIARFDNMLCAFLDATGRILAISEVSKQAIGIGVILNNLWYREEIFSCAVARTLRPTHVALVSRNVTDVLSDDHVNTKLPIQYPEVPKTKGAIINCVSVTFGQPNITRLIEWLELQRLLGMDRVELHTVNLSADVLRVLQSYTADQGDGFVLLVPLSPVLPKAPGSHLLLMSPAINDCMYRNMHRYKAMAVFDMDEIIVPRSDSTYEEMMNRLRSIYRKYPYTEFLFSNVYYFLDIPGRPEGSPLSVLTRHTKHVQSSSSGYAVKSIIDPRACMAMHNHYCWVALQHLLDAVPEEERQAMRPRVEVDLQIGANQHYKYCHFKKEECADMMKETWEDHSLLRVEHSLVNAVGRKLRHLGM